MQYPNSPLLKEWAEKLVQTYDRDIFRGAVVPAAILFVEDTVTGAPKPTKSGKPRRSRGASSGKYKPPFDIRVLHPALAERLDADYMVIFYKMRAVDMTPEKLQLELMDTLMGCQGDGKGLNQHEKVRLHLAKVVGADYHHKQFPECGIFAGGLLKGLAKQATFEGFGGKPAPEPPKKAEQEAAPSSEVKPPEEMTAPSDTAAAGPGTDDTPPDTGDGWQPAEPYVKKDNVVQFPDRQQPAAGSVPAV